MGWLLIHDSEIADLTEEQKAKFNLSLELRSQVYDVFVYMNYHEWNEICFHKEQERENGNVHLSNVTDSINSLIRERLYDTASHSARVTLYCSAIADFLRLPNPKDWSQREALICAAETHDYGKLEVKDIAEKIHGFTDEDKERIKRHTKRVFSFQKYISQIALSHHKHQKKGYGPDVNLTPEQNTLSQILALADYHDSAYSRPDIKDTSRFLSPEEVRARILEEYSALPIVYEGKEMPKLNLTGEQLINGLFEAGIFGREDRFNPFKEKYSFIWRPTVAEKSEAVKEFVERLKEMARRERFYNWMFSEPKKSRWIRFLEKVGSAFESH